METHQPNLFKHAMIYGLYLAGISIVITVIVWATALMEKLGLFGTMAIGLFNMVVLIYLLIYFTKNYRNEQLNGKITFGQAFVLGVLIVVFSTVVTSLYSYIFAKYIDPGYQQRLLTMMQDKTYQFLVNQGTSEDKIEEAMRSFEEQTVPTPLGALFSSLQMGLIAGAIVSLISSAIVKKNVNGEDSFDDAMEDVKTEE